MTRAADLQALHDAVREGVAIPGQFRAVWPDLKGPKSTNVSHAVRAYENSLDAAHALHMAVLPDLTWEVWLCGDGAYACNVEGVDTVFSGNPGRAWLISILAALIAKEQQT